MYSSPESCSSTKARCRIGRPTATQPRQRLTCRAVLRVTQTLVLCFINSQVTPEVAARFGAPPADAFTIAPALVQPTSKGSVRLASDNFQDAAVIDGNYLGTDHDFAIVRAIEAARLLGNQHAFDNLPESELISGTKRAARRSGNLPDLPGRVLDIQWYVQNGVGKSWLWSTLSFACTALRACVWRTPP